MAAAAMDGDGGGASRPAGLRRMDAAQRSASHPGLIMDNRGEDKHEEELDFHLGTADDSASDDENMSLNSSLSSMGKDIGADAQRDAPGDGSCAYDKGMFTRMAAGAGMKSFHETRKIKCSICRNRRSCPWRAP